MVTVIFFAFQGEDVVTIRRVLLQGVRDHRVRVPSCCLRSGVSRQMRGRPSSRGPRCDAIPARGSVCLSPTMPCTHPAKRSWLPVSEWLQTRQKGPRPCSVHCSQRTRRRQCRRAVQCSSCDGKHQSLIQGGSRDLCSREVQHEHPRLLFVANPSTLSIAPCSATCPGTRKAAYWISRAVGPWCQEIECRKPAVSERLRLQSCVASRPHGEATDETSCRRC